MSYDYPYDAPEGAVDLVKDQFNRFSLRLPNPQVLDKGINFVIEYVAKENFFPSCTEEALQYLNNPDSCKWRIEELLGPTEYLIKAKCFIVNISIKQLACLIYGTLLFSWSDEGEEYVKWFSDKNVGEALRSSIL